MKNRALASLAFALAVAACGGGHTDVTQPANPASSDTSAPSSAPAPTTSAAPAATEMPDSGAVADGGAASSAATPPGPPAAGDWEKWSHEQKLAYMKSDVMPKMGALFHGFDAKTFDKPNCKTCHGKAAEDGSFKMPNADLPKLDVAHQLKSDKAKHPKMFEFMASQVEPQMASLLGMQPYDVKTQQGFGCLGCHTAKK